LQQATAGAKFNNLLPAEPQLDFAAHAMALGALAEKVSSLGELEEALGRALAADRTYAVVIETDPEKSTEAGGAWWDVPVAEVSERSSAETVRKVYDEEVGKVRR